MTPHRLLRHNPIQPATLPRGPGQPRRLVDDRAESGTPSRWHLHLDEWKSFWIRLFSLADPTRRASRSIQFTTIRRPGTSFPDADFGSFDENQMERAPVGVVDKRVSLFGKFDKNGDCLVTQDEMKGRSNDQKPPPSGQEF